MNTNEISPKASPRLKRVKKVIWIINALIGLAVVSVLAIISICLFGIVGWADISPSILTV